MGSQQNFYTLIWVDISIYQHFYLWIPQSDFEETIMMQILCQFCPLKFLFIKSISML